MDDKRRRCSGDAMFYFLDFLVSWAGLAVVHLVHRGQRWHFHSVEVNEVENRLAPRNMGGVTGTLQDPEQWTMGQSEIIGTLLRFSR